MTAKKDDSKLFVWAAVLSVPYAACVYFQAATASLDENYQVGIEALKLSASPGLFLATTLLVALIFRRNPYVEFSKIYSKIALIICALIFLLLSAHNDPTGSTWVPQSQRTMRSTLETALFNPSLSKRSFGSVVGSAIFAGISLLLSTRISKKHGGG